MSSPSTGGPVAKRPISHSPLIDWEGAADRLGVTPRMVKELWTRRQLSGVKVGRHVRFSEEDLDRYIAAHRVEAER